MSQFLKKVWARVVIIVTWIAQQPIIEPILDLLRKERTLVIIGGVGTAALLRKFFPDLDVDTIHFLQVAVVAFFLLFFYGMQREVWKEADAQTATLPTTPEGWVLELLALLRSLQGSQSAVNGLVLKQGEIGPAA